MELIDAVKLGRLDMVKRFLENPSNLESFLLSYDVELFKINEVCKYSDIIIYILSVIPNVKHLFYFYSKCDKRFIYYIIDKSQYDIITYILNAVDADKRIVTRFFFMTLGRGKMQIAKYIYNTYSQSVTFNSPYYPTIRQLYSIAAIDSMEILIFLKEIGFDFSCLNNVMLVASVLEGKYNTVKFLLDNGANIHANDEVELVIAVDKMHKDIAMLLLENGADYKKVVCIYQSDNISSILFQNQLKIYRMQYFKRLYHMRDLSYDINYCHFDYYQKDDYYFDDETEPINLNKIINIYNFDTFTLACARGLLDPIRFMMESGYTIDSYEPIKQAIVNNRNDVIRYIMPFIDPKYHEKTFLELCMNGNLEMVKYLIDDATDPHIENDSALVYACINGNFELVEYLISLKCDTSTQNNEPMVMAVISGHSTIVEHLLKTVVVSNDDRMFYFSCREGHVEIAQYLLDHGISYTLDINKCIHAAIEYDHYNMVKFLVKNMDVLRNYYDYFDVAKMLQYAVLKDNKQIVNYLNKQYSNY